jgi:hypothetical protein
MRKPDDQHRGLSPLALALALSGSAAVWLVVNFLRGHL